MADSNALNFWGGLLLGVGVTAAAGYWFMVQKEPAKNQKPETELSEKEKKEKQDINFQFYGLLPELEVVLPEDLEQKPIREQVLQEQNPELKKAAMESEQAKATERKEATRKQIESLPGAYYLQTGSFSNFEDAERMKARLSLLGFEVSIQQVNVNGKGYQRVRVGPFDQIDVLQNAKDQLAANSVTFMAIKKK